MNNERDAKQLYALIGLVVALVALPIGVNIWADSKATARMNELRAEVRAGLAEVRAGLAEVRAGQTELRNALAETNERVARMEGALATALGRPVPEPARLAQEPDADRSAPPRTSEVDAGARAAE